MLKETVARPPSPPKGALTYGNVPYRGMQCAIERLSLSGIVPNKEEHSGFIRAFSNSHL